MNWESRKVGQALVPPDDLLAHPWNVRIHPKEQQDAMIAFLSSHGWLQPVIVSRATGMVIDGHMRVMIALRTNQPTVPVDYVELTEQEERQALALLHRTAYMSALSPQQLEAALQVTRTDDLTIAKLLSAFAESAGLLEEALNVGAPPERPVPAEPALVPTPVKVRIGQFKFTIEDDVFRAWMQALIAEVGRDRPQQLETIVQRLGLHA